MVTTIANICYIQSSDSKLLSKFLLAVKAAPEDLLELLDPADPALAEVDLDMAGELLVDHILQHLHQALELGAPRPGAGGAVFDRYGFEFAHAGCPGGFH